jgi:hypothetical protein
MSETYHLDDDGFLSLRSTWHYKDGIRGKYVSESVEQPPTVLPSACEASANKNYLRGLRVRARWQQGGRVLVGQAVRFGHRAVTHTDPELVSLTVDIAAAGRPPLRQEVDVPARGGEPGTLGSTRDQGLLRRCHRLDSAADCGCDRCGG